MCAGGADLVAVGSDADPAGDQALPLPAGLEDDPLALAEVAEDASLERPGAEVDIGAVGRTHHHTMAGGLVVDLHHPLHGAMPFEPCRP